MVEGFTKKYSVHRLVYFEEYGDIRNAITREKQLKKWNRAWKIRLIDEMNPGWQDLYELLTDGWAAPLLRGPAFAGMTT